MPITYGDKITALRLATSLNKGGEGLSRTFARLSSGARITRASDDAASIAIATSLQLSSKIFAQAARNISDGVSQLSMAEGALRELSSIAQRQLELAEEAANGTYTLRQRSVLDRESTALTEEWNRIIATTKFNGRALFDTSQTSTSLQVGGSSSDVIRISIGEQLARNTGTGYFTQSTPLSTNGTTALWRVAADFNLDGNLDLATFTRSTGYLNIQMGTGTGTFNTNVTYSGGVVDPNYVTSGVLADVNRDGAPDLISTATTDGSILVWVNNGNGTFKATASYAGGFLSDVEYGDVNGDGYGDILSSGPGGSAHLRILYGNSNGTFKAAVTQTLAAGIPELDLADVNNDGYLDLIGGSAGTNFVVMLGNGNGTFKVNSFDIGLVSTWSGRAADFNNDGILDIAVSDYNFPAYQNRLQMLIGNGDGTFKIGGSYVLNAAFDLVLADINNDGFTDVSARSGTTGIQVVLSNGDGSFSAVRSSTTATGVYATAFGDFNNDGVVDSAPESSSGNLYLGQTTSSYNLQYLDITTQAGAQQAISTASAALERVNKELGVVGAGQARLAIGLSNVESQRVTHQDAYSRIMDADIAAETAELTKLQILQEVRSKLLSMYRLNSEIALQLLDFA